MIHAQKLFVLLVRQAIIFKMEYVLLQVEIANLDITLLISEIQILYVHNVQMHNVLSVHKRTNVANVL